MVLFIRALSARVYAWATWRHADLDHYGWGGGAWLGRETRWVVIVEAAG